MPKEARQPVVDRESSTAGDEAKHAIDNLQFVDLIHEVRNPLNGMSTAVQLIVRRVATTKASEDAVLLSYADSLMKEITHLNRILLDVQTIWAPDLRIAPIQMDNLIGELLKSEPLNSAGARIRVETDVQQNLPVFESDEKLLKHALANLIKNSLEAMPDGGTLTLHGFFEDKTVIIEVMDTGSGIPEQINVFTPRSTSKPNGMGLGLNIVKHIVDLLHGEISYSGGAYGGTTFRLSLPQR